MLFTLLRTNYSEAVNYMNLIWRRRGFSANEILKPAVRNYHPC